MNKKLILCVMTILLFACTLDTTCVKGNDNFTVTINGIDVIFNPPIEYVGTGVLLVSTEAFATAIGAKYEHTTEQIYITYQNTYEVTMMNDVNVKTISSANIPLGIIEHSPIDSFAGTPRIIDGHFFVPLGALTRGLQFQDPVVDLHNRRVHINTQSTPTPIPTPVPTPIPTPIPVPTPIPTPHMGIPTYRVSFSVNTLAAIDGVQIQAVALPLVAPGIVSTMINPRVFADFIGTQVAWNELTRTMTFTGRSITGAVTTVSLGLDNPNIIVNGQWFDIATRAGQPALAGRIRPVVIQGRSYVPARVLAEIFGIPIDFRAGVVTLG